MGTNCAPLVADLFLFCYERGFMMSLSDDKQADVIDGFNITSRYLDDILNINNVYFDNMVSHIYSSELQLNKANTSDTEAAFLDVHLSISNDNEPMQPHRHRQNIPNISDRRHVPGRSIYIRFRLINIFYRDRLPGRGLIPRTGTTQTHKSLQRSLDTFFTIITIYYNSNVFLIKIYF